MSNTVGSDFFDNPSVSAKAKGIYGIIIYLQSKGIANPTIDQICQLCADGRDSVRTGLEELRSCGFLPAYKRIPPSKPQTPGYIYLIQAENTCRYKIGLTQNPQARIKQLSQSSPITLSVVHTFQVENMGASEDLLHSLFSAKRIGETEWFDLDSQDVTRITSIKDWGI